MSDHDKLPPDLDEEADEADLAPIRPPTVQWLKRLAELKAFLAVHGRYPKRRGIERGEVSLYDWLTAQRHAFLAHKLTWNQAVAMDVLGDWITTDQEIFSDDHWQQRLADLLAFRKRFGRLPNRRHFQSDEEDALGIWMETQVSARNRGSMPAWRVEAMNAAFPGWAAPQATG
ncbi:helicase associated domain-containing protein [Arthrobacter sp. A2-55]|uniref:helicase associated domain-containing protein n=1 Tax=Arthrobacter sp. A2-55 TaxID=2897337 RepID=UPI0021CD75AF|nr:helicase associated domain-containing protein [Arthrobacter sp. A2-55]MCU6480139.1 helicase associated domain-containing protein [Arthrobacter sp. A2-55]